VPFRAHIGEVKFCVRRFSTQSIYSSGHRLQMRRVAAGRVSAKMINLHAARNFPNEQVICKDVRANETIVLATSANHPIALPVFASSPNPAVSPIPQRAIFVDTRPQSVLDRPARPVCAARIVPMDKSLSLRADVTAATALAEITTHSDIVATSRHAI
jgi:hypothetical protein